MMIRILGTTRDEFFSNAIRKVTKDAISHVAVQYGDKIIHANRHGVIVDDFSDFIKHNEIIYSIKPCSSTYEEQVWETIQEKSPKLKGHSYDQFYLTFFALRLLLRIWFLIPLPKDNLWNISNMYICTELVSEAIGYDMDEMLTPHMLLEQLVDSELWVYC